MDTLSADPELASELVKLLNKELQATRAKLEASEQARVRSLSVHTEGATPAAENYRRRAHDAEAQVAVLSHDNEILQEEVSRLREAAVPLFTVSEDMKDDVDMKSCLQGICPAVEEVHRLKSQMEDSSEANAESIAQLRERVIKLKEKYEQSKAEKLELHDAREAADAVVVQLTEERDVAFTALHDAQRKVRRLEEQIQKKNEEWDNVDIADDTREAVTCFDYMADLPPIEDQTNISRDSLGLKHVKKNLQGCLTKEIKALCAEEPLVVNELFMWASKESQHAIVLSPAFEYHAGVGNKLWVKTTDHECLLGQTREVFFHDQLTSRWNYAGTFKCLNLFTLITKEYKQLSKFVKSAVMRRTLRTPHLIPPIVKKLIADLYDKGVAKVECTGLQCIGFNHDLYDSLKALKPQSYSTKRKQGDDGEMPNKKAKHTN
ncbi:hypothetical protein SCP_0900510 [Sparassis crispa]|uniref:DUF6697 domain-containing protein n=1 Tax=Sparassis crispa TaxID=139825 RepID=A0A401GWM9_9APHY|nr:hypothetical protein SCP_0900510 [Sparassis crispa]GBE86174.1 hypothetical protein SCP_0900510 [Sparassis crispa]